MKIAIAYDGYEHLGLGYLAAMAQQQGHHVELIPLDLGDYIRGRKPLTDRRVRRAAARVATARPDVAAFSLNSFSAADYSEVARALRPLGIRTLAGGPHATAEPRLTIGSGAFDGVVSHEAESVFVEAAEHLVAGRGSCPAWLYTQEHLDASPPPLPDVDHVPIPQKELFYRHAPFEAKDYKIITSRGCPFRCIFCGHSQNDSERRVRRRSVDRVVEELRLAKQRFHPSSIYFLDDVFTLHSEWLNEFLRA